jgi:hypothetical protein
MRLITRPQNLIRAFFGLGPDQFRLEETIVPVVDVEAFMRSNQDSQIITGVSAAIVPGARGSVEVSMPSTGSWLLHHVTVESTGPATTGNFRMMSVVNLKTAFWAIATNLAVFDKFDSLPRIAGSAVHLGRFFDKPVVMYRNAAGVSDSIFAELFNEAASVGNATITVYAMVRPLESIAP